MFTARQIQNFWRHVRRGAANECWPWTASVRSAKCPYGKLGIKHPTVGRIQLAHRMSYMISHGAITSEQQVLHSCDNPRCVNPAHLFLGTHAVNMADRLQKGRCADTKGTKNGRAKLTPDDVLAMCAHKQSATFLDGNSGNIYEQYQKNAALSFGALHPL